MTGDLRLVTALIVRDVKTREEVKRVLVDPPLSHLSSKLNKMTLGLLRNLDAERYFVDEEYQ